MISSMTGAPTAPAKSLRSPSFRCASPSRRSSDQERVGVIQPGAQRFCFLARLVQHVTAGTGARQRGLKLGVPGRAGVLGGLQCVAERLALDFRVAVALGCQRQLLVGTLQLVVEKVKLRGRLLTGFAKFGMRLGKLGAHAGGRVARAAFAAAHGLHLGLQPRYLGAGRRQILRRDHRVLAGR
jgi:hypothetical protein